MYKGNSPFSGSQPHESGYLMGYTKRFYLSEIFKMKRAPILILLILQQVAGSLYSQPFFFTNYTIKDGLSNNNVTCITRDDNGYIWIGTEAGLNRFNGYNFTIYKSLANDTTTITSNNIRFLLSDYKGNLWSALRKESAGIIKNPILLPVSMYG